MVALYDKATENPKSERRAGQPASLSNKTDEPRRQVAGRDDILLHRQSVRRFAPQSYAVRRCAFEIPPTYRLRETANTNHGRRHEMKIAGIIHLLAIITFVLSGVLKLEILVQCAIFAELSAIYYNTRK